MSQSVCICKGERLSYYRCWWSGEKSWINPKNWREEPGIPPHHSALEPLDFSRGTTPELDLDHSGFAWKAKYFFTDSSFLENISVVKKLLQGHSKRHTTNDPGTVTFLWS